MSKKSFKPNLHQRRGMEFRESRNNDAMQQDRDRLANKYNFKALDQWEELEKMKHYDLAPAAILPMSTRGIGIILAKHWDMIMSVFPNLFQTFDQNTIYRYSLLQLEGRRRRIQSNVATQHPEFNTDVLRSAFKYENIYTNHRNFSMLAEAINSFGIIDHPSGKHVPSIPQPDYLTGQVIDDGVIRKLRCIHPNPHFITIMNLRDTVEALTSQYQQLVTPEMRQHFKRFNPIPGLKWDASGFVINPDDIIVSNYEMLNMELDIAKASNFFNLTKIDKRLPLGEVNYDEVGDVSALCSIHMPEFDQSCWRVLTPEEVETNGTYIPFEPPHLYVGSPYKTIEATVMCRSLAYLMSEIVPNGSRNVLQPDMLHVRNRFTMTSLCTLNRRVVVDAYGKR